MGQNIATLTHYTLAHKYVLYTEDYSLNSSPVSMISPFTYNGPCQDNGKDQEEVHRYARGFGLDRAKALGVELVEKVEEDER